MTTLTTGRHRTSTIAWRFTTCTSANSSTERAHVVLFLAHFITLTSALKFEPCPHSTHGHPHAIHVCDLFTLNSTFYFPAFLLSVFLFPFFHLSDEQQPELNKKIMENLCDSANNGGEGTYDVLYLTTTSRKVKMKCRRKCWKLKVMKRRKVK